jgi:hypothetical protein
MLPCPLWPALPALVLLTACATSTAVVRTDPAVPTPSRSARMGERCWDLSFRPQPTDHRRYRVFVESYVETIPTKARVVSGTTETSYLEDIAVRQGSERGLLEIAEHILDLQQVRKGGAVAFAPLVRPEVSELILKTLVDRTGKPVFASFAPAGEPQVWSTEIEDGVRRRAMALGFYHLLPDATVCTGDTWAVVDQVWKTQLVWDARLAGAVACGKATCARIELTIDRATPEGLGTLRAEIQVDPKTGWPQEMYYAMASDWLDPDGARRLAARRRDVMNAVLEPGVVTPPLPEPAPKTP